jgi:hypothetical protein
MSAANPHLKLIGRRTWGLGVPGTRAHELARALGFLVVITTTAKHGYYLCGCSTVPRHAPVSVPLNMWELEQFLCQEEAPSSLGTVVPHSHGQACASLLIPARASTTSALEGEN